MQEYPINKSALKRNACIAILKCMSEFWDLYEELGNRFFVGANCGVSFQHCRPLAAHVLAICFRAQNDEAPKDILNVNLAMLCRESRIIDSLINNDKYWLRVCDRCQLDDEAS